jgi:hypothetical protein
MSAPILIDLPLEKTPAQTEIAQTSSLRLLGICALLIFGILSFGAVEEWSTTVVELSAAILFLSWVAQQFFRGRIEVRHNPLYRPVLLFGLVAILQIALNLTAYRYDSLLSVFLYAAYAMVFFVTLHSLNGRSSPKTILWTFTAFGSALAIFAVCQDFAGNGKIFWLRHVNAGWIFGPYVNHDHYAGIMEMLLPFPLVLSLSRLISGGKRALVAFAAIVMAGSIFLSQSRGGTASFLIEVAFLFALLWRARERRHRLAAGLGALFLLILGFAVWAGTSPMWRRLSDLQDWMRVAMAKDGLRMFWHKPILGWGLGTFPTVYPPFRSFYTNLFVNAAHNDYVQVLVETGIVGFSAVLWFILSLYRSSLRNRFSRNDSWNQVLRVAALVGCTGILVHSSADFNLQIPANALFFYFLCALATSVPDQQ